MEGKKRVGRPCKGNEKPKGKKNGKNGKKY